MAKRVRYELVDDIDGSAIPDGEGESIDFSVDGVDYTIDLKTKNANDFRKKIDYYIENATRIGGRKRRPTPAGGHSPTAPTQSAGARTAGQTREIRQWAADNDYDISDRGRIPAAIVEAFHADH